MSRRIALIVGVSQYDKTRTGLDSLAAPVNDAQAVYEVLHQYGGFDTLYPLPLGTEGVDASGFVPSGELVERLAELLNPQAGDEVELAVIYFSGHGVSERGQVVYLSASDERLAVAVPWLADLAKHSAVKNVCLWLDCCHSGEVLKFADLGDKGFCVVAASHADGEALALDGRSLLTELLCKALIPGGDNRQEIKVPDFVQAIEAGCKNFPQQVLCRWSDAEFTLTQLKGEVAVNSRYSPDDDKHRPYRGLLAFTKEQSEFFFGRDGMIYELRKRLSASRFVPLLGASGSGKSSLVLAGLLPKLPESDWQVLVMRPTAQPLQNLRDTLVRGFPDAQVGTLASGADLQREVLRLVTAGKRLLLVIDQFEEVFTECRDDTVRAAFFACLLEALDGDNPLHLVLTLRADFLGHCTEQAYSGLGQRLQHHALLLVAPTAGELREAITRPLALVGMRCEQALEDELVDQTLHAKGSLPLLQYVLEKLWQSARQERSRELTLAMYQQLGGQHGGGLRGVLNEKADAFYQQLEPQQQRLMEWLMVELTQIGDGQDDTRRTVTLQELHNRQPQYTAALDALLVQLVTHERLLTQDHDDHGQTTITVAHEALIRDWQRLRGWLESNREIKSWRTRLEDNITAWKNKVSGSLLREKRLAEAQRIQDKHPDSLLIGQDERAFIAASQAEAKRRKQLWVGSLVTFIVVLLVGIVATTWQWQEADRQAKSALVGKLASQSALAMHSPSLANGYIAKGLLLAVWAFRLNEHNFVTKSSLLDAVITAGHSVKTFYLGEHGTITSIAFSPNGRWVAAGVNYYNDHNYCLLLWDVVGGRPIDESWPRHEGSINAVVFSPDGKWVVSGSDDKTLRLWDASTGQPVGEPWRGHENKVSAVAASPNGKWVVSGSDDKTLRLWDASTGQPVGEPWRGHENNVSAVAVSPNGKWAVSGSDDKTLRLWDISIGQPVGEPWRGHEASIIAVAFSPDGQRVVSGSVDKTLRLWDISTGKPISESWRGHEHSVTTVKFSPDGKWVVSGSVDKTLRQWDASTGKSVGNPWRGHEEIINAVAFSPDGKWLISGGFDTTLRLWDSANDTAVSSDPWHGHEGTINAVAFSPDGKWVVSGSGGDIYSSNSEEQAILVKSSDNTLRLWNSLTGQLVGEPWRGHDDGINAVAFSPNGKWVVSGSEDKTLRLWDASTGKSVGEPWRGHEDGINTVAFSPDGKWVVSGSKDKTLRLWDASTGKSVGNPWRGHEDGINTVAFNPDGRLVISGGYDEKLSLWDAKSGVLIKSWKVEVGAAFLAVSFSPSGNLIVTGNLDKGLRLWNVETGKLVGRVWYGHNEYINAVAFSPNGQWVVSGSFDKTLRLWDVETGKPIGEALSGHSESVSSIAFSPDGKYVVSAGEDKILRLWDADPESWAKKACSIVNRNFSLAEWQRFIGDAIPYEKTCPDLPAPGEEGWVEPYAGG